MRRPHLASRRKCFSLGMQAGVSTYCLIDRLCHYVSALLIYKKKTYFNGVPTREMFMSLPAELGLLKHVVANQTKCVYGTRDAGMIWEQCYRDALENIGVTSGV